MESVSRGIAWIRDLVEILVLDRFHPGRRRAAEAASTAARVLRFRSRALIPALPLAQILDLLGARSVDQVQLPGPKADRGEVGDHTYYHTLASLIRGLQPAVVLEFGTYLGMSAYTMALNAPPSTKIFTVDLPDSASAEAIPGLNAIDQGHIAASRQRVGAAFLGTPFEKQITQIRADSMSFRAETAVPPANLVFVDGGHSLEVVQKDTENAFRVLAPGGIILWDDYFHLYPGVVTFLNDLSQRYPLRGIEGTNFVIYQQPPLKAQVEA